MAKTKFKNLQRGARGVWDADGNLHMIEPGKEASIEVSKEELADQKANKQFAINGKAPRADSDEADEPDVDEDGAPASVLDQGVKGLKEHLETVTDIEELNKLGAQEAANANRTGALNAIQERIEELQKAEA